MCSTLLLQLVVGRVAGELVLQSVADFRPLWVAGDAGDGHEEVCPAELADVRETVLQLGHHVARPSGEAGRQNHPAHCSAGLLAGLQGVTDAADGLAAVAAQAVLVCPDVVEAV